jgi:hypothetical protein
MMRRSDVRARLLADALPQGYRITGQIGSDFGLGFGRCG